MKYFVVSDVHSFYTPLKTALDNAGFDPENENHTLISCGDLFDRGAESEQVLNYIMSLPRKILVRGNHESMLMELVFRKRTAEACDQHNGTIKTIFDLGGAFKKGFADDYKNNMYLIRRNEKLLEYFSLLVDYYETNNYIFVHSWVPTTRDQDGNITYLNYKDASAQNWEEARWVNPFMEYIYMRDMGESLGKTIVFGHWHTAEGHARFHNDGIANITPRHYKNGFNNCDIFHEEGIIGLDACTVISGKVNCLVIED